MSHNKVADKEFLCEMAENNKSMSFLSKIKAYNIGKTTALFE